MGAQQIAKFCKCGHWLHEHAAQINEDARDGRYRPCEVDGCDCDTFRWAA